MGFQTEIKMGDEIRIKGARLYPLAKVVQSTFGKNGGFVWNRPNGMFVKSDSGEEFVLEIRDVTRETQVSILALGFITSFLIWLFFKPRHTETEKTGNTDR